MQGDFSRVTFDPSQRFSAVLSQQGRVQLDSEINEQTAILLHYVRTLAADLLGPAAFPPGAGGHSVGGFCVDTFDGDNFTVTPGRIYVDGILCECDGTDYWSQSHGFLDREQERDRLPTSPFMVYLRVWERLVTAIEAPGIREVALGLHGPDTTVRTQVVWQLCWLPLGSEPVAPDMQTAPKFLRDRISGRFRPRALLSARVRHPETDAEPCDLPPDSGYRGPENQLYRVEIHRGGTAETATFKWSRENGSVTLPVRAIAGTSVMVETLGRDDRLGVEIGDIVELVDDLIVCRAASDTLEEGCPRLYTITDIDYTGNRVVLDSAPADDPYQPTVGTDVGRHPLLRRWDHGGAKPGADPRGFDVPGAEGTQPVMEDAWLPLEEGLEVWFEGDDERPPQYRRGDYWLIPVRVVTGDVLWPCEPDGRPQSKPPQGVNYHYAPLAVVVPDGPHEYQMVDVRQPIPHLRNRS
ncbi:DUF6519 domain-containing protein [Streptomyces sp. NPDC002265]|uniref:DUF6519 domain-containing protein n=1 Tax=Streptomyces sp. NPDC002265 TaxID=3154415 RepID=UPI003323D57C